jgi:hypothetical protein
MSGNGRRWTDQEAEDFLRLLSAGRPFNDVCVSFGRNPGDARKHLREIGALKSVEAIRGGRPRNVAANPAIGRELVDVMPHPGEPKPAGDVDTGCRWLWPDIGGHKAGAPPRMARKFCGAATLPGSSWCQFHRNHVFARANGSP